MTQNIKNLFKNLKDLEPSAGLGGKILKAIVLEKNWQAKKRLIFADVLMLGSLGAFVFVLLNFWDGISKSEFWSLSKLLFSDTASVATFWKDFLFSLLETFPAVHLAAILAPVLLLMISLNMYFAANNHNRYEHN
ncbi:MAG: hypothetical protein A3J76_05470 [Candidatus Moranbacteria bacterium RBG_13_45_13]|nr:MAG: hypothetical protein A3J76_05470 [Candidatus Moranbacteria bacterium RBG_13_45_13]